jgi:putative transposase
MCERKEYTSNLTDAEWTIIEPLLPEEKLVGRDRGIDLREVLNAIYYRGDNGVKWRNLPSDFPAWQTVYGYFRSWVQLGIWESINAALVTEVRKSVGREAEPSLTVIDSQSVKLGQKGGEEIGVDGNKKVKGRKRHIAVDVLGLVLKCHVSAANCADVKMAPWVLFFVLEQYVRIEKILADKSYRGDLVEDLKMVYGVELDISNRVSTGRFEVEPLRWVVERTWAWLDNARILARDYERLPENHAGMVYIVMIRLMLRRLTKNHMRWKEKIA